MFQSEKACFGVALVRGKFINCIYEFISDNLKRIHKQHSKSLIIFLEDSQIVIWILVGFGLWLLHRWGAWDLDVQTRVRGWHIPGIGSENSGGGSDGLPVTNASSSLRM